MTDEQNQIEVATPFEALKEAFLNLCKQYDCMGQQLACMSRFIALHQMTEREKLLQQARCVGRVGPDRPLNLPTKEPCYSKWASHTCALEGGHPGPHFDPSRSIYWDLEKGHGFRVKTHPDCTCGSPALHGASHLGTCARYSPDTPRKSPAESPPSEVDGFVKNGNAE